MSVPVRPTLVFDGECGFCRRMAARWRKLFDAKIDFVSFDECLLPVAKTEEFHSMVRFVGPEGTIYGGAAAVSEMLAFAGHPFWLKLYRLPVLHWMADTAYHFVGTHRKFLAKFL